MKLHRGTFYRGVYLRSWFPSALFVYRVRGFSTGNGNVRKLMDRVLCIMQFSVMFFLAALLLFFVVQGDSMKLQAIYTLRLLVVQTIFTFGFQVFERD